MCVCHITLFQSLLVCSSRAFFSAHLELSKDTRELFGPDSVMTMPDGQKTAKDRLKGGASSTRSRARASNGGAADSSGPDLSEAGSAELGTDANDLSEYEQMRLANIHRNNALLESLDIQADVVPIAGSRMPRPLPAQAPKPAGGSSALPEASVRGMRFWPKVKVICPWGFKGGIYKTTTTINTAVALAGKQQN